MEAAQVHPTVPRLVAVACAAVLVLAGCGSDADPGDEAAPTTEASQPAGETPEPTEALDTEVPDLCTLFTADDFLAVTGEMPGEPEVGEPMGAIRGTCTISAENGFPLVILGAYDESDREATMSMVEAEPVDDLGVEAYWDDTVGLMIPLEGKDWYLQVMATDAGADLATSVEVARIALDRLDA